VAIVAALSPVALPATVLAQSLLDRPDNELARLQRSRQRRLHGGNGPEAGDPGVPA